MRKEVWPECPGCRSLRPSEALYLTRGVKWVPSKGFEQSGMIAVLLSMIALAAVRRRRLGVRQGREPGRGARTMIQMTQLLFLYPGELN